MSPPPEPSRHSRRRRSRPPGATPIQSLAGAPLTAHIDGGARGNPGKAGYGVSLTGAGGKPIDEVYGYLGVRTNNVAEYAGLIAALEYALRSRAGSLAVRSDSELLVRQVRGDYRVRQPHLRLLHGRVIQRARRLPDFRIEHVYRQENREADRLANQAMDEEEGSGHFTVEEILGAAGTTG